MLMRIALSMAYPSSYLIVSVTPNFQLCELKITVNNMNLFLSICIKFSSYLKQKLNLGEGKKHSIEQKLES